VATKASGTGSKRDAVRFEEVAVTTLMRADARPFEISLRNGRVVRVHAEFEPEALPPLLAIADEDAAC
jgi:hypothetical protein